VKAMLVRHYTLFLFIFLFKSRSVKEWLIIVQYGSVKDFWYKKWSVETVNLRSLQRIVGLSPSVLHYSHLLQDIRKVLKLGWVDREKVAFFPLIFLYLLSFMISMA
jgi:hypothetical protein